MINLLFSFAELGDSVVQGLTNALGNVWYSVLVNFIGVLAISVKILETQNKKRSRIVILAMINYLLWITYFILYGNFTAGIVNGICCVQALVFLQRGKRKWADSYFWLVFFIAVQLIAGVFTWQSPFSLFSIVAGLISTVAYFVINEKLYRWLFLALILLWIGNGIVYFYPIAIIHDVFATISISIAIVRYNFLGKDNKRKALQEQAKTENIEDIIQEQTTNL